MPINPLKSCFRTFPRLGLLALGLAAAGVCGAAPIYEQGTLDKQPEKVFTVPAQYPAGFKESGGKGMVVLELLIDTEGRVSQATTLSSTDPRLSAAAIAAALTWRYKPGIKDRSPVYTRIRVPFNFGPDQENGPDSKGRLDPPVVTRQQRPEYPFSLRMSGINGEVMVGFIVDLDGNVVQPTVLKSSHPDFEAPTIEAILNWKFKPGRHNGQPVYTQMEVPVFFQLNRHDFVGDRSVGVEAWSIPSRASAKLPDMYQYDEPPRPLVIGAPVYPFELLTQRIKGRATISFAIDPAGRTRAITVASATRPEFGAAAAAMVGAWRFDPAMKGGKPSWALMRREQVFDRDDVDFPMNDSALRLLKDLGRKPCPVMTSAAALDAPLKGRYLPGPIVPASVAAANSPVEANIEFIVDHAGHAQLPRVTSATNADFAWAAATAVSRWQFNAPTCKGRPVDVFAMIPFSYKAGDADKKAVQSDGLRGP